MHEDAPWRTGEDTRHRVMASVLADAVVQPEVGTQLAFVKLAKEQLLDDVLSSGPAIFSAAEHWEYAYRKKVLLARSRFASPNRIVRALTWRKTPSWLTRNPLWGQLVVIVLAPAFALTFLAVALWSGFAIPDPERATERWAFAQSLVPVTSAVTAVAALCVLWLHRRGFRLASFRRGAGSSCSRR